MATTVETPAPATETPAPATTPPPPAPSTAIAPAPSRERIATQFDPNNPIALYMDTGIFEQLQRVATMMAKASLVPAHLQGKVSDCFLVVAQSFRWGMDPFSVAPHTFVLSGKLGYEGKLIAALVNASGRLEGNLRPTYTGAAGTLQRGVVISARLKGETQDRTVEGTVAGWQTQNVKWKEIPDQMLVYRGAREWARRHMPEVMLGITADEELADREPLQRIDGGTRVVPALDVLTDTIAQRHAVEKIEAAAKDDDGAGGTGVAQAAPTTRAEPEGLRCDHGILLTGSCPKCIADTKGTTERVVGEDDADPRRTAAKAAREKSEKDAPVENPFIRKQKEAAAKEADQRAAAQRATGER